MERIALPIYKVKEQHAIADFNNLMLEAEETMVLTLPVEIEEDEDYEVEIEYYTDPSFSISMYAGSEKVELIDSSQSGHKVVKAEFSPSQDTNSVTLILEYVGQNPMTAYIAQLIIRKKTTASNIRYITEKWEFHDAYMGERYVLLTATYHEPIDWHIGDFLIYRGQKFSLSYVPSATQNARQGESGNSFVYENIKFEDDQGKFTNCMILDITPTTGDYVASLGTNYTGSSVFTLYCAETDVTMVDEHGGEHIVRLSPVAYLGGVIQANLNRLYPEDGWRVDVNPDLPHLDDKIISFNQWYVSQGLAEIHNQWKVDYVVVGHVIKIGYTLGNITGNENEAYMFGYGEGYAQRGDDGKSLFQIKRTANAQQNVITRLRAMGSTRNMPYRYYNNAYSLPQTMFVRNLQLPDTFLPPIGTAEHKRANDPDNKAAGNANRDNTYGVDADNLPILRHVLGDTNDAYIDKNDDAANCTEGIREGSAMWDGSNSDLEEIYPTIKSGTYRDLRAANIPDMDGRVPSVVGALNAYPNYGNDERIDEVLGVDERTNIGDGIMAEADAKSQMQIIKPVQVAQKTLTWSGYSSGDFEQGIDHAIAKQAKRDTLFTIEGVSKGKYQTEPVTQNVKVFVTYQASQPHAVVPIRYMFTIYSVHGGIKEMIAYHASVPRTILTGNQISLELPSIPNIDGTTQTGLDSNLVVEYDSEIVVEFALDLPDPDNTSYGTFTYYIDSDSPTVKPEYIWEPQDVADTFMNTPFAIYIKDIGIDLSHIETTGEDATIHFNTGACGGMEFKWNPNTVEPIMVGNKKGWKLEITERFTDDTINAYYPNANSPVVAGDQYVLLNIEFPDAYIRIAELRLLDAATKHLADNCETKFTYEPVISDIYIQQNIDYCKANGMPQKSIYWNLYAGYKFSMRGIPSQPDEVLPVVDNITIKSVTIREGEQDTPKVELVLNDEVEQTTIQRLTTAVDRIYNGIFGGSYGGSAINYSTLISLLNSEGSKIFLSRQNPDTAQGRITFNRGTQSNGDSEWGEYVSDTRGAAIWQDADKNWHIETDFLLARKKLIAKEVQIEDVHHVGGQQLLTAARMYCDFVVDKGEYWRCFFRKVGTDGKIVHNEWEVNDQAYVKTFNLDQKQDGYTGNHYFWRLVVGTSETLADSAIYIVNGETLAASDYHFIDLSKTICGALSDEPIMGDNIVQLGYQGTDDDGRQNAIIIAGAGDNSPYIYEIVGINSFNLPEPETILKPGNNLFTGKVTMQSGSKLPNGEDVEQVIGDLTDGQEALRDEFETLDTGNTNMLRNTGFTGDYETEDVAASDNIGSNTEVYSRHLKYWDCTNVTTSQDTDSASGISATLTNGLLMQEVSEDLEYDGKYCVSIKAKGTSMTISFAGHEETITLAQDVARIIVKITCKSTNSNLFKINGTCTVMEIMLTKGTIPNTDWLPSPLDNNKALAYYQNLAYLANAITKASTTILGGLVLTEMIRVGNYRDGVMNNETGGMSGVYSSEQSPFLWGGGSMEQAFYTIAKYAQDPSYTPTDAEVAQMAKFVVTHGGRAILNDIVLRGYVYALGGYFKGEIHADSGFFKGTINADDGYFKGMLQATSGSFTGTSGMYEIKLDVDARKLTIYGPSRVVSDTDPSSAPSAEKVEYLTIGDFIPTSSEQNGDWRIAPTIRMRRYFYDSGTFQDEQFKLVIDPFSGLQIYKGGTLQDTLLTGLGPGDLYLKGNGVTSPLTLKDLPTSDAMLTPGEVWNNNGTLKIKQ